MALPTQQAVQPPSPSVIGATYGMISRFHVQSSDVIDDELQITVTDERLERVEWKQVRVLAETEIIEVLTHVPSGRVSWTTNKPTKGWYIRLRSPMLPPGASIPLTPLTTPDLSPRPVYLAANASPSRHSYPPNSPATSPRESISSSSTITLVQDDPRPQPQAASVPESTSAPPPSAPESAPSGPQSEPASSPAASSSRPSSLQQPLLHPGRPPSGPPPSQITHFLITPDPHLVDSHGLVHQQVQQQGANQGVSGFFSTISKRIIGAIEHRNSFTIRIPSPASPTSAPRMLTLLTFYDTTPALRLGTPTTGTIELDEGIARLLGVDRGFYIAACLAFLEFLGDKEEIDIEGNPARAALKFNSGPIYLSEPAPRTLKTQSRILVVRLDDPDPEIPA
ncbi:hypothetical protein FRC00_005813 [Tulasnella sp. 408]|nr:hypothetical protein FRC00_005813 [Tulasnella sp. 408]